MVVKKKSVLNSFNLLRQGSQKLQIRSGIDVLDHLWSKQSCCGLEDTCKELQLGIDRIVRGLGAPRSNSRKGFFLTFVGLCKLFSNSTITIQMCFDAIKKELNDFSSKGEEKDMYKGQILAYGGLIYSGKVLQSSKEEAEYILREIYAIGCKKSYLELAAHTFLVDWINRIDEEFFKKSLWNVILKEIILSNKDRKSLQWHNLLFVINKRFPCLVDENLFMQLIGTPSLFHEANSEIIKDLVLTTTQTLLFVETPVYQEMFSVFVNNKIILNTIWSAVDNNLTSATPGVINNVFKLFIFTTHKLCDKNWIKKMLKPNFIKIFSLKSNVSFVEKVRHETIAEFSEIISKEGLLNAKTQDIIVQKLLFYPGSLDFLQHPAVKIVHTLVNSFSETVVKSVFKHFIDVLNGTCMKVVDKDVNKEPVMKPWKDGQKKKICKIIIILLNHPTVVTCIDWKVEQIKFIIDIAFFSKTVSSKLRQEVRRCFYCVLDFKFTKLTDFCLLLHKIVDYLDCKLNDNCLSVEFSKEMRTVWKKMHNTVKAITNSGHSDNRKLTETVFHSMFLLFGITLFNDANAALDNLKELHAIHKRMSREFERDKVVANDKEEPHWTDVVVDLILSSLSYNSHFHRNVISRVFVFLCPHLCDHNIHQILAVLNPNEERVLSSHASSTIGSDEEDSDSSASDEDSQKSSSEESDLEDEIEEDKDHDKLRACVREALGDAGTVTDTESIDLDDLDEEEGKRLDESLSMAFRQRRDYKLKSQSADHKQLSDFRIRVVDLLEVWVKSAPELNVIFDVMVTVLMLLENSLNNRIDLQLETKLRSFLKQLTSVKQFTFNNNISADQLVQLTEKLINKDEKTASVYINMSLQIVECCTFILKVSLRDLKPLKKLRLLLLKAYQKSLHDFFHKTNSTIPIGLFKSAFALPWEGLFDLIEDVLNYSLKADTKPFHLANAFNFLHIFVRNKRLLTAELCDKYSDRIQTIVQKLATAVSLLEGKPDRLRSQFIQICQSFNKLKCINNVHAIDIDSLKKNSLNRKRKSKSNKSHSENTKRIKSLEDSDRENIKDNLKSTQQNVKKRKSDKYKNALKLKKRYKFARSEELSKGIENQVFGNHLLYDSEPLSEEIQT